MIKAIVGLFILMPSVMIGLSAHEPMGDAEKKDLLADVNRLHEVCRQETSALWGVNICGEILFVDTRTRKATGFNVASAQPTNIILQMDWPADWPLSNTTRYWQKRQWAVITWPMTGNSTERLALMLHESYHRVQGIMKFSVGRVRSSDHLDDALARILIQTEARYLKEAIIAKTPELQFIAAVKALFAHQERLDASEAAAAAERYQMLYEGLAEYTGHYLARDKQNFIQFAAKRLEAFENEKEYSRSFAYYLAPAWGIILDIYKKDWQYDLNTPLNLADIFADIVENRRPEARIDQIKSDKPISASFKDIISREEDRQQKVLVVRQGLRARFIDQPVIVLPADTFQIDPRTETSLGQDGKVFEIMEISGEWGEMKAHQGAMIGPRPPWVYIELLKDKQGAPLLHNDRYNLTLEQDWVLVPHERGLTVKKKE